MGHVFSVNDIQGIWLYLGFVLLPVTVSKQISLFLNKAFTNHHHPLLQPIGLPLVDFLAYLTSAVSPSHPAVCLNTLRTDAPAAGFGCEDYVLFVLGRETETKKGLCPFFGSSEPWCFDYCFFLATNPGIF